MNDKKSGEVTGGSAVSRVYDQFCFTYAIDGGAWVIRKGEKEANWLSYSQIEKAMGKGWFERMRDKQGMFTGCWVKDV